MAITPQEASKRYFQRLAEATEADDLRAFAAQHNVDCPDFYKHYEATPDTDSEIKRRLTALQLTRA
ncbi:hypothetical protein GAV44_23315 [Salmonella enterica subsp. enterica serovar Newport]|nr:hypothetical protein [Salmonella enterica subsp. enterica serovar Newport]